MNVRKVGGVVRTETTECQIPVQISTRRKVREGRKERWGWRLTHSTRFGKTRPLERYPLPGQRCGGGKGSWGKTGGENDDREEEDILGN